MRLDNTTTYAYDGQDRLQSITDPAALVTTFVYGGDGKLNSVTDPASRVTLFDHNGNGDLTKITDPDLSERDFSYDGEHRLTQQLSKRGFPTSYDFDFAGRAIQANRPNGTTNLFAPAEVVGLIDPASGFGTVANPVPFTRPDEIVGKFTDGNDNATTYNTNSLDLTRFRGHLITWEKGVHHAEEQQSLSI